MVLPQMVNPVVWMVDVDGGCGCGLQKVLHVVLTAVAAVLLHGATAAVLLHGATAEFKSIAD